MWIAPSPLRPGKGVPIQLRMTPLIPTASLFPRSQWSCLGTMSTMEASLVSHPQKLLGSTNKHGMNLTLMARGSLWTISSWVASQSPIKMGVGAATRCPCRPAHPQPHLCLLQAPPFTGVAQDSCPTRSGPVPGMATIATAMTPAVPVPKAGPDGQSLRDAVGVNPGHSEPGMSPPTGSLAGHRVHRVHREGRRIRGPSKHPDSATRAPGPSFLL